MQYIVTGRVHPERADIRFERVEWEIPNHGRVVAVCDSSQITVILNLITVHDVGTAYIQGEHFAVMVVCALGFALGSGYSVEMIQVIEENGNSHVFGVRPSGGNPGQTLGFAIHDPIFNRTLRLASQDLFFRLALRDFLRAITDSLDCAAYCYRAIEGIKSAFVVRTGMERWDEMHAALGTDRATIENAVKHFADPVRHGNWVNVPTTNAQQRWEMLLLTRDILLKYLDHKTVVN